MPTRYSIALAVALAATPGCSENFADPVRVTFGSDDNLHVGEMTQDLAGRLHVLYDGEVDGERWVALRSSLDDGVTWDDWFMVQSFSDVVLAPGEETDLVFATIVHPKTPYGDYDITVLAGPTAQEPWDSDSFVVEVDAW